MNNEFSVHTLGNLFVSNIDFSVDAGRKKQKGKLKVAETKSPHLLISRINTDVSSVPPSRSSETRSISMTSHLNPPQVDAIPLVSFFPLIFIALALVYQDCYSIKFY